MVRLTVKGLKDELKQDKKLLTKLKGLKKKGQKTFKSKAFGNVNVNKEIKLTKMVISDMESFLAKPHISRRLRQKR